MGGRLGEEGGVRGGLAGPEASSAGLQCGAESKAGHGAGRAHRELQSALRRALGGRRSPRSGDGAAPEITMLLPSFCYHLSISLDTGVFFML